jgi:hypothetical protein
MEQRCKKDLGVHGKAILNRFEIKEMRRRGLD